MNAHFEMIGGASGNMLLGALVDAGAEFERIERALRTIPVPKPWALRSVRANKRGIAATLVTIEVPGEDGAPDHVHDANGSHAAGVRLGDVLDIVERSGLDPRQRARATAIYQRLAHAEACVHGVAADAVHFHEVGTTDAILDVAGTCVALDLLEVESVTCSAFPVGRGNIGMAHGTYPNPPPATAELLRGFATFDGGIEGEMVTTTGAAILTTLAPQDGTRPAMRAERIGYGAGTSDFAIPNVLRVLLGPLIDATGLERVAVLEANVDDMSPQYFELALERAFAAGALDAWLAPITMKKSRPGILFGVLAPLDRERACAQVMLAETTTLGVRVRHEHRYTLERHVEELPTEFGPVRIKIARVGDAERRTLEYEDVARIARSRNLPVAEVVRRLGKIANIP